MTWKAILGALIRCEISASYDRVGNIRVTAKGAVAVLVLLLVFLSLNGKGM